MRRCGVALNQLWKDVKGQLPEAVTGETVAFAVGVIVGSAGKAAAKGKLTMLGVLFVVLEQIAIRFGLNVFPEALKLTAAQYAELATTLIQKLREVGVMISDGDVRKIVEEMNQHPREVKEAFEKLQTVFKTGR